MSGRVVAAALGAALVGVLLSVLIPKLRYAPAARAQGLSGPASPATRSGPRRVICMSPAVTEIVFALGQGGRVAGISEYTTYPPEALKKPQCGGFFNPNFERILSLRPDLIITQGRADKLTDFARDHGIGMLSVELEDLESVFAAIQAVGEALRAQEEADLLCAGMRLRLAQVRLSVKGKPRPRMLLLVSREPGSLRGLTTVGPNSFLNDLLDLAGGENIFADVTQSYATVSKETLLERQPEVIIELHGEGMIDVAEEAGIRETWAAMAGLPAVRSGRIYAIGSTYAMIPGPRLAELAERLAVILHGGGEEER